MIHEWSGLALPSKKKGALFSNQECSRYLKNPVLSQNIFTDGKILRERLSKKISNLIEEKLKTMQKQGELVSQHAFLRHFQAWLIEWKRLGSLQDRVFPSSGQLLTPKQGTSFILSHDETDDRRALQQEYCSVQSSTSSRTHNNLTLSNSSTVKEIAYIQEERIQKLKEELERTKEENKQLKESQKQMKEEKENLRSEVQELKRKMRSFLSEVKRVALL